MRLCDISIIITTRNEEENIAHCLESARRQTFPQDKIEIIVVDNDSTDKTKEIARRYSEKVYNFGPERSSQRNYGVKNANGTYILYLDADMILNESVLSECIRKCENENLVALYIPERIIGRGFWVKVRDFERSFYDATVIDCVRFVRKNKSLEIGGFDEDLTGPEDWDFDRRIKQEGAIGIIESPIYHNEGGFAFSRYIGKKAYYARSCKKYIDKWGRTDPIIRKQFGLWYRFFGVFIEKGKWLRLIKNPLLTLGLYYLRFLVGFSYLTQKEQR